MSAIPDYSLALVAYTASTYHPIAGARKNQVTANLNILFGVVLYEPVDSAKSSGDSSSKGKAKAKAKNKAKAEESSGDDSDDAVSE
jgi:hypothetical protein